jgi:putative NADH-flavin reductase
MRIGIIGATGNAGSALYQTVKARGLEVTAIVRNGEKAREMFGTAAPIIEMNAFELTRDELEQFDIVINAFSTPIPYQHVDLAAHLIKELRGNTTTKIYFIIGAASLIGMDGHTLLEKIVANDDTLPWRETPIQQSKELQFLELIDNVEWMAVSPQGNFIPGPAKEYQLGTDHLLFNSRGESVVATGTMAAALVDQILEPTFPIRTRFTVGDK